MRGLIKAIFQPAPIVTGPTEFLNNLKLSDILTDEDYARVAKVGRRGNAEGIAVECVRDGLLTPWQAGQLLAGNPQSVALNQYQLLHPLGQGSMGQVHKAIDRQTNEIVAIKIMAPQLVSNKDAENRFRREARTTTKLQHPNIVKSLAVGECEGSPFLVLEYLAGNNLAQLLRHTRSLPALDVAQLGRQVALALAYAHSQGIVHRDVKPSNIWVQNDGTVKLLDLGLAKFYIEASKRLTTFTATGQLMGTVDYIAPEQARDSRMADQRSDLYSLGCTLYQALTGQVPHPGMTAAEKLTSHLFGTPTPILELNPDVPSQLAKTVSCAMSREPDARPQSAHDLLTDLDSSLEGTTTLSSQTLALLDTKAESSDESHRETIATLMESTGSTRSTFTYVPGSPRKSVSRRLIIGTLLSTCVVLLLGLLLLEPLWSPSENESVDSNGEGRATTSSSSSVSTRLEKLTLQVSQLVAVNAPSDDCRDIRENLTNVYWNERETAAYLDAAQLVSRLSWPVDNLNSKSISRSARESLGRGNPDAVPPEVVAVIGDGGMSHWQLSRDIAILDGGRQVASASDDATICIWNRESGKLVRSLIHPSPVMRLAVSPNQRQLISGTNRGELFLWNLENGELLSRFEENNENADSGQIEGLVWSPDGSHVATASLADTICIWRTDTWTPIHTMVWQSEKPLSTGMSGTKSLAMAPNGLWLANASRDGAVRIWSMETGELDRTLELKAPVVSLAISDSNMLVAGTADGKVVAWNDLGADLLWERQFDEIKAIVSAIAFSPDGDDLAISSHGQIELWDAETGDHQQQFQPNVTRAYAIRFLPDGQTFVTSDFHNRIRNWDVNAGTLVDNPTNRERKIKRVCCSPDGKLIAATGEGGWLMTIDASTCQLLSTAKVFEQSSGFASFSPDSTLLAMTGDQGAIRISAAQSISIPLWTKTPTPGKSFSSMEFMPDGNTIAIGQISINQALGRTSFSATIHDSHSGDTLYALEEQHGGQSRTLLAPSPDSKSLHVVQYVGIGLKWDYLDNREHLIMTEETPFRLHSFTYSPDAQYIGVVREFRTPSLHIVALLLDPETCEQRYQLDIVTDDGTFEHCNSLAFSPDGRLVALAGKSGTVSLWNISVEPPQPYGDPISINAPLGGLNDICFLPDGRHLLTHNKNLTACVIRLAPPGQVIP